MKIWTCSGHDLNLFRTAVLLWGRFVPPQYVHQPEFSPKRKGIEENKLAVNPLEHRSRFCEPLNSARRVRAKSTFELVSDACLCRVKWKRVNLTLSELQNVSHTNSKQVVPKTACAVNLKGPRRKGGQNRRYPSGWAFCWRLSTTEVSTIICRAVSRYDLNHLLDISRTNKISRCREAPTVGLSGFPYY